MLFAQSCAQLPGVGCLTPRRSILLRSVFGCSPRISAAPFRPEIRHPVDLQSFANVALFHLLERKRCPARKPELQRSVVGCSISNLRPIHCSSRASGHYSKVLRAR